MGCRGDASTGVVTPPKKENFWKHLTTTAGPQCGFCRGDASCKAALERRSGVFRGEDGFVYLQVNLYLNPNV